MYICWFTHRANEGMEVQNQLPFCTFQPSMVNSGVKMARLTRLTLVKSLLIAKTNPCIVHLTHISGPQWGSGEVEKGVKLSKAETSPHRLLVQEWETCGRPDVAGLDSNSHRPWPLTILDGVDGSWSLKTSTGSPVPALESDRREPGAPSDGLLWGSP